MNRREMLLTCGSVPMAVSTARKLKETAVSERRMKIVYVGHHDIVMMLQRQTCAIFTVQHRDIPNGVHVVDVTYCSERRSWSICIAHESFDPVNPGCIIPSVETTGEIVAWNYEPVRTEKRMFFS